MFVTRPRLPCWAPAVAVRRTVLAAVTWLALASAARADVTTLDGVEAPIVRINLRQGNLTVRTWERHAVAVDGDPALLIERRTTYQPADRNPVFIPAARASAAGLDVTLPAESFVISSVPAGPRDQIVVRSPALDPEGPGPRGPLTVTVPSDSVFVFARTGNGDLDVRGYRAGTLVGFVGQGRLSLEDVGGTVFAQSGRGAMRIDDSNFDRLRVRSLFGNMAFERCRVRQIEATSANGSIVFDAGSFDPGLARFESTNGDIAIGTAGSAQIGAHAAGQGRIYTNFERSARVDAREAQTMAVVGGGGPVVTATTQSGSVYLYDGSLRDRNRALPASWQTPLETLDRPAARAGRERGFRPPLQRSLPMAQPLPPRPTPEARHRPLRVRVLQFRERVSRAMNVQPRERRLR